jgi:hypothetical protein
MGRPAVPFEAGRPRHCDCCLHRLGDLADTEPVPVERPGIDLDLVLADLASERRHVGDPGDLEQARGQSPSPGFREAHSRPAGAHDHVA